MLGFEESAAIFDHLKSQGFVDAKGKVQDTLRTALKDGSFALPAALEAHLASVRDVLKKVAGKLDIKNADERVVVKTRQAILESAEFQALWDRIKHKTTYRVHFDNEKLIVDCAKAIANGPPVSKARVRIRKADLSIGQGGVRSQGARQEQRNDRDDRRRRHRPPGRADRSSGSDTAHAQEPRPHFDRVRPPDGLQTQPAGVHRDRRAK